MEGEIQYDVLQIAGVWKPKRHCATSWFCDLKTSASPGCFICNMEIILIANSEGYCDK